MTSSISERASDNDTGYAAKATVVGLFLRLARRVPSSRAVVGQDVALTYGELDAASDALGSVVAARSGPGPEPVAVLASHGPATAVAILGALKSGRPISVLDSLSPPKRVEQVIDLAQSPLCLVSDALRDKVPAAYETVSIDAYATGARPPELSPPPEITPETPCVVQFTSGSTGEPKGIVQSHRFVVESMAPVPELTVESEDRVAVVLPLAFSMGLKVFLGTWINGAAAYFCDPRESGMPSLVSMLADERITVLSLTPPLLRSLSKAAGDKAFESLRRVMCGGEVLRWSDVRAMRKCLPPECHVFNHVGSSETGRMTYFEVPSGDLPTNGQVPMGRPYGDVEIELIDEEGSPVPDGIAGEVVVTRSTMPDGYWRRPDLTAERYSDLGDGRLSYRTGDLARRENGLFHYVGRIDRAVKVGSYRVEPAEIESALSEIDAISEAVVVSHHDPVTERARLVAYIVPSSSSPPSATEVRRALRARLPSHMVPERFVLLQELPLNSSGKVDVLRLPAVQTNLMSPQRPRPKRIYVSAWHERIEPLFAQALELETVGYHDDFFEMGGDSLAAQELIVALAQEFGAKLTFSDLLEAPTVDDLAARMKTPVSRGDHCLVPLQPEGSGAALFLVTGAGGMAIGFFPLSRSLGDVRPIYGLQARGIEHRAVPNWTIGGAARRYLRAMRKVQAHGPYLLVGHSAGCWIAYEMAQQLKRAGEQVPLLGLLEPPGIPVTSVGRFTLQTAAATTTGPGAGSVQMGKERSKDPWPEWVKSFSVATRPYRHWAKAATAAALIRSRTQPFKINGLLFGHTVNMCGRYRPAPWPGRTVVYSADNGLAGEMERWAELLVGEYGFRAVGGGHISMMSEPYVSTLAKLLREDLDSASAATSVTL